MTKRKSDFREDRDWNVDLPHLDDVVTPQQQHEYHRLITKKWNAMPELPSSIWEMPFPKIGTPWWQIPGGYDPESYQRRRKRIQ
jgi:hypothetical protein